MIKLLSACVISSTLIGCASVTGTTGQSVSVETLSKSGVNVSGASCELSNSKGKFFVNTPGTVPIRRSNDDMSVVCRKDGIEPGIATVVSETKGMMFGNILLGGGIGALVDHNTGAAYEYPSLIQVMMGTTTKIEAPKPKQDDSAATTQSPQTPQANQSAQLAPQQASNSPSSSIADRLSSLNELKSKGLITQKDYDSKKAELLKSM
jgi:hypothetical protein